MNTATHTLTLDELSQYIDADLARLEAVHAGMITPQRKGVTMNAIRSERK